MSEETVYICDKLEGLVDAKPSTRPCRKAVNSLDGTVISLEVNDYSSDVKFCSPAHANFWLSRQRVPR